MHRASWILITLLAITLAGCADDAPAVEEEDGFGQDLKATDDTGVIRGVVIDPSIVPVANVKIQIQDGPETSSNDLGEFGFTDLGPGTYFLKASKAGFAPTQASVVVEAGIDRPPIVKILLERDPSSQPFVQQYTFEGFLQCSASASAPGVVGVGGNLCSILDVTGQPIDDPLMRYDLERRPDWIQTELVWDSTQPAGDALELYHSWECDTNDGFLCDHGTEGVSPLILQSDNATIEEAGYGPELPLIVRVFAATLPESQGTAGVTFDQRFTHYTTIYYGFQPDDGWSFVADGAHPLPE